MKLFLGRHGEGSTSGPCAGGRDDVVRADTLAVLKRCMLVEVTAQCVKDDVCECVWKRFGLFESAGLKHPQNVAAFGSVMPPLLPCAGHDVKDAFLTTAMVGTEAKRISLLYGESERVAMVLGCSEGLSFSMSGPLSRRAWTSWTWHWPHQGDGQPNQHQQQ